LVFGVFTKTIQSALKSENFLKKTSTFRLPMTPKISYYFQKYQLGLILRIAKKRKTSASRNAKSKSFGTSFSFAGTKKNNNEWRIVLVSINL
jgi:hypothetical protein